MSVDLTFNDIPRMNSIGNFHPHSLYFPAMQSYSQQEWEYYVTKLHGADLAASSEDLQTLKNLVNKLGR